MSVVLRVVDGYACSGKENQLVVPRAFNRGLGKSIPEDIHTRFVPYSILTHHLIRWFPVRVPVWRLALGVLVSWHSLSGE